MDNLTHTLIGVVAVQPLVQSGLARLRRSTCIALVAIGSNLPDIDLLYTYAGTERDKLTYMLDHRGYTHTVIGCLVLAAALYILAWLWMRRRGPISTQDHTLFAGSALLGTLLHLSMDALNSYGVHPFWPFLNRWLYGDSVFIVEPLYWAATAPLLFTLRSVVARVLIGLVLAATIGLSVLSGLVPTVLCIGLAVMIALLLAVSSRVSPRMAAGLSLGVMIGITAMFIGSGAIAARRVEALAQKQFVSQQMIDHVLTPMPANPFCWDLLLLQRQGDRYTAKHAVLALAPSLMSAAGCPERSAERQTARQAAVNAPDTASIRWLGQFSMSVSALKATVRSDCVAARAMAFMRAPFVTRFNGNEVIGDLRYDREPQLGFSELQLASVARCSNPAPWVAPRADLLR